MQENLGEEYKRALEEVLRVRESRMNQYGNTYLEDDFLFLYYQVQNKMKRFSLQLDRVNNIESIKDRDVALDSAVDCVNYALFIIAKLIKDRDREK
jgi:hypothetical protein